MNANANRNGQQRKSLASQIDRLDTLLDGLADGLNEAVATVVQEAVGLAVKEAVRAVLIEVLQNQELLTQLRPALPAGSVPEPSAPVRSRWRWLWAGCRAVGHCVPACRSAIADAVHSAVQAVSDAIDQCVQNVQHLGTTSRQRATTLLASCWQVIRLARAFPGPLLTGLAVGVATGCVVYHAGPWLSVAAGSLGGFVVSSVLHLGLRLRSLLPLLLPD